MAYQSTTDGGNYTADPSGAFPGTSRAPGTAPSELPPEWRNARVVTTAPTHSGWLGNMAQVRTADQMLVDFDMSKADASQTEALQMLLWRAGYFGDDKTPQFIPGERDQKTRDALIGAIKDAARSQQPFGDLLDERSAARASQLANTPSTRAPFSPQVSNPTDVRLTLQAAAQKVLGQDLPQDKIDQLVSEFQSSQVSAQQAAYTTAATGGASVAAPDLSSFAMDQARRSDPVKADARTAVQVAGVIEKMMSGGA